MKQEGGFGYLNILSKCMDGLGSLNGCRREGRGKSLPITESLNETFLSDSQDLLLKYTRKQKVRDEGDIFASSDETHVEFDQEERFGPPNIEQETSCSGQQSPEKPTYCCEADKGEAATAKSSPLDIFRRSNPKHAATRKSILADKKSTRIHRIICRRKVSNISNSTNLSANIFSEVKRKRRGSERRARLFCWGSVEDLIDIIKHDGLHMKQVSGKIHIEEGKSKKGGSCSSRKKGISKLKNGKPHLSATELVSASSLVDAQVSCKNVLKHFIPTSNDYADSGTSNRRVKFVKNNEEIRYSSVVTSMERDVHPGDMDLASTLTHDTSVGSLLCGFRGLSSQINVKSLQETSDVKQSSDPGSSPDSNVYHPIMDVGLMSINGSMTTPGDVGVTKNRPIQDQKSKDGSSSAALTLTGQFAVPSLVSKVDIRPFWNQNSSMEEFKEKIGKRGKSGKKEKEGKKEKNAQRENKDKNEKRVREIDQVSEHPRPFSGSNSLESTSDFPGVTMIVKASLRNKFILKKQYASNEESKCSKSFRKHCKRGSKSERCSVDSYPGLGDLNFFDEYSEVLKSFETSKIHLPNVSMEHQIEAILPSRNANNSGSSVRLYKGRSNYADSIRSRRHSIYGQQKRDMMISDVGSQVGILLEENGHMGFAPVHKWSFQGDKISSEISGSNGLYVGASNDFTNAVLSERSASEFPHVLLDRSLIPGKKARALCDDCQKWRYVPYELVHASENGRWTCKDNMDESFSDYTIPQEKRNEEIIKEREISNNEYYVSSHTTKGEIGPDKRIFSRRATWTLMKTNLFLNRNKKSQNIDEIMVCHCKLPKDGGLGCRDECLNRMLNIECVEGTCPCGHLCSNQQFQKRKYAKFQLKKCGKKGYGLQLEEDVSRGQFLVEYVGEVLDLAAYDARLRYYASRGHKHFYFMMLNGGEVIDACGKGNFGRFINHSCDPNCRTEKWMVNGEVCIGLFAIRDIKKGEEVTFDYNYVRVFGAAVKRCLCGSTECRGYIGGDPSISEVILPDDSDEDVELVMIDEDHEIELRVEGIVSDVTDAKLTKHEDVSSDKEVKRGNDMISERNCAENEKAMHQPLCQLNQMDNPLLSSDCFQSKETMCTTTFDIQPLQDVFLALSSIERDQAVCKQNEDPSTKIISRSPKQMSESYKQDFNHMQKDHRVHGSVLDAATNIPLLVSDSTLNKKILRNSSSELKPRASKPCNYLKSSHPIKTNEARATNRSVASQKVKTVQTSISHQHIEGVEQKLNELLDADGGIQRQKDAAKWYLKLLVVTAAAGDDVGGNMSQSARDLSLILDAILKTKSRTVLEDIMNKNGLQMLHNMMKQNHDNFNRIPILRKLLKVLEFLAEEQILTPELINLSPPCSQMESFKVSLMKLTKHRDSQVHTLARNFANHWMPCSIPRSDPSDRVLRQFNSKHFHNSSPHASKSVFCHKLQKRESDINPPDVTRIRKRKSRWDQPLDFSVQVSKPSNSTEDQVVHGASKLVSSCSLQGSFSGFDASTKKPRSRRDLTQQISDNDDDEIPPGFGFPYMDSLLQAHGIGQPQERYLPELPVSYGIPYVLMQQLGATKTEGSNHFDLSFAIAPAMPFKPFPPLPSYPRRKIDSTK